MAPSIYLAVGHGVRPNGSFDPGAVAGSESEQSAGDVIVDRAAEVLEGAGIVVHDEAYSADPNFVGSAAEANRLDVDLTVEIHHDWSGAPQGGFGFWYPGSSQGKRAADLIYHAIVEAGFPTRPGWHKATDEHYILRETDMPCVLFEVGRIGDFDDGDLVRMGDAVAAGVAAYFGVPLTQPEPVQPKWAQVVLYDPSTDGRDYGAAAVLAKRHNLRLLPTTSRETAGEAYMVGKASYTADLSLYDRTIVVTGDDFEDTANEVAIWTERLERL